MPDGLIALTGVAASVALVHTLAGPDHYIPFIAMARAGKWTRRKTIAITLACGAGHVASSLILGALGVVLALEIDGLMGLEASRGEIASWMLIGFGLIYTAWALRQARRGHTHSHVHMHADGTMHRHVHTHHEEHLHAHPAESSARMTPWVLFVVFLLGPCEPLIPLLMVEGMVYSWSGFALVAAAFALVTLLTMVAVVLLGLAGFKIFARAGLERHVHVYAGASVLLCGLGIRFLGL